MFNRSACTLLLLFGIAASASAATREVGSGRTYSTIAAGIAAATAGDTVLVYPGTYTESTTWSNPYAGSSTASVYVNKGGSAGAPLTIRAAAAGVIIDGQNRTNSCFAILRGAAYVVVDGFECRNFTLVGKGETGVMNTIESRFVTIQNNTIINVSSDQDSGDETAINMQGTTDSTIRNNRVNPNQSPWGVIGVRASWGARNTIEENQITGVWAGLYISQQTDDWVIRRNYVTQFRYYGFWIRDSMRVHLYYNVIENGLNTGYDNAGILLLDNATTHSGENHNVHNNTINNTIIGIQMGTNEGSRLRNNLIMNTRYGVVDQWWSGVPLSSSVTISYNMMFNVQSTYSKTSGGSGNLVGVNPGIEASGVRPSPYYRLRSDSPAINAGDPSIPLEVDFMGLSISGGRADIGAFEMNGTGGAAPPIAPSNLRILSSQ
jgi:nitrous oxidase accessory protein